MGRTLVVDYGVGNIGSVVGALTYLGEQVLVSGEPREILSSDRIILPGVGSFARAMDVLEENGCARAIRSAVLEKNIKVLGVCLGMQLLCSWGSEGGGRNGLGLAPGRVERFTQNRGESKMLNIGFAAVQTPDNKGLFEGLSGEVDFYFVHEFRVGVAEFGPEWSIGIAHHDQPFVASFQRGNVLGVQFHPEKSQTNGLHLLANFLRM